MGDQVFLPPGLQFGPNKKIRVRNNRLILPNRLNIRSVMASPPTITVGTSSSYTSPFFRPAAATIGTGVSLGAPISDIFSYCRGALDPGSSASGVIFNNVTATTAPAYASSGFGVSFLHYGSAFELIFGANSNFYLVKVDGQYVTLTPQYVGASGSFYAKYDFGSVGLRRIDVIGSYCSFSGVNIAQTDGLMPAPIRGPRTIVLSDSFGNGSGATGAASNNFVAAIADALGWDDVWPSGVGGTGYLANNGGSSPTFRGRALRDVISYAPEVVWIVGSVNDDSASPSAISAEALLLYRMLVGALPNAIVIASPTATKGANSWSNNKLAVKAAQKAAAAQTGVLWVDPIEMPLTAGLTPPSGVTLNSSSAGLAGSTGMLTRQFAQPGSTIELSPGTVLTERINVTSCAQAGNDGQPYYRTKYDGALQFTQPNGAPWVQVGGSYLTGIGRVGATTGYGTADLWTSADAIHPSDAGHLALGQTLANLLVGALAPN